MKAPRVVIVMGVAGSGKTTIGKLLADRHAGVFHDADDFHPQSNVEKMAGGRPLDDADRLPWLKLLRDNVIGKAPEGRLTILACSALKHSYREILGMDQRDVATVFLQGDMETLGERINSREGHYMKPGMLTSQMETLEAPSPQEAIHISIRSTPAEIVREIEAALGIASER